jgi:serine/threonine protein kinase
MDKKKYSSQYQFIKIIKKTESTITYLANKNYISFKNIIRQIDLSKITDKERAELENEININSLFNSRFILKIEDSYQNSKQLNIISEYFEGITLKDFLLHEHKKDRRFLKEEIIWKIFIQLSLAIYRIHIKNIIHRNIKTSTVFLDTKYNLKLTYFKDAYLLKSENDLCKEEIEPKNYMAPEIFKKEGYNTKSDIWSLGVILYEMCTFNKPFDDENQDNLYQKIINAKYASIGNKYSKELIALIDEMLRIKPEERISIKDIIHKYVFISRSKETNLFDYVDKVINPQKSRILSSKTDKRYKRPQSAVKDKKIKKSVNAVRNSISKTNDKNKEENKKINKEDNKINNDIEILTQKFFDVKKNVVDLIGKEKSNNLFEELSNNNIDEIMIKYSEEDINSEKSQKFKGLLIEYAEIMTKVCQIKNKI